MACVMTFRLELDMKLKAYNDYFAAISQQQVTVTNVSDTSCNMMQNASCVLTRGPAVTVRLRNIVCQLKICQRLYNYEKSHLKRLAIGKMSLKVTQCYYGRPM